MEEATQSSPITIILFAVLFIAIFGFVGFRYLKQRKSAWQGTVVDKDIRYTTRANNSANNRQGTTISFGGVTNAGQMEQRIPEHYLKIQTTAGKSVSLKVSDGIYQQFNIGDPIVKASGTMTPVKPNSVS